MIDKSDRSEAATERRVAAALANLRHLYQQMLAGQVLDMAQAARGLLGPSIEVFEHLADRLKR